MEQMMTVKDVAVFMQLSEQTIQRYVFNREIPYHKIIGAIRFRRAEIETWIDGCGVARRGRPQEMLEGDLFSTNEKIEVCE